MKVGACGTVASRWASVESFPGLRLRHLYRIYNNDDRSTSNSYAPLHYIAEPRRIQMDARLSVLAAAAVGAWTFLVNSLRRPLAVEVRTYRLEKYYIRGPGVMPLVQPAVATRLPQRPDPSILSDAIPLFFIGRNRDGFWVARDADRRVGGIFVCKQWALRFADRNAPPLGCAKMFLSGRFELDIENKGNPLVAHLGAAKRLLTRLAQRLMALAGNMAAAGRRLIARFSRALAEERMHRGRG